MAHTATQMLPAIGQTVRAQFEDLTIDARVSDVKSSYGRVRLLVSPVSGTGKQWIEVSRLRHDGGRLATNAPQLESR